MSSPSDITSVVWSAVNLPNGLTLGESTGIISGTPTTPGTYTTNITVVTNWGTDTKSITINVAVPNSWKPHITEGQILYLVAGEEMEPYEIEGINVRMTSSLESILAANDWHGIHEYVKKNGVDDFVVGTEVMTKYTEPLGTNAGVEYDLPCILVDKSTAINQDGIEVPALYFMSKYALPCTGIHAADQSGLMFDNKEPSNGDYYRQVFGNNRYMHSAIRQWLNGTGTNWWSTQHSADAAPDYTGRSGLLSCLSADLVAELQAIKVQVHTATDDDGGITDMMYDKIFLPSFEEINRTDFSAENTISADIAAEGIEGHAWQYWKDKLGSTSKVGGGTPMDAAIIYGLEDHTKAELVCLRSAARRSTNSILYIYLEGTVFSDATNLSKYRVTPAFAIIGSPSSPFPSQSPEPVIIAESEDKEYVINY